MQREREREKHVILSRSNERSVTVRRCPQISHLHVGLYVFLIHLFIVLFFLD